MNQKTAKLLNKAGRLYGIKSRKLKRAWNDLPRSERHEHRKKLQQKVKEAQNREN